MWHPDRFHDDEKFKARAIRKVQDINESYRPLEVHYQNPTSQTQPKDQPPSRNEPNTTKLHKVENAHLFHWHYLLKAESGMTEITLQIGSESKRAKYVLKPIGKIWPL